MKPLSLSFLFAASVLAAEPPPIQPLETVVAAVATRHPELAFYAAEIEAAKAAARLKSARREPELALELGRKRVKDPAGAPASDGTVWSLSLTQTFDWPGRLALRKAIANRDIELAELGLARFRHALEARARTLGCTLAAAHTKAEAIREVADRFADLKETFLAREPAGITPQLEARVIEAAELALQRRATTAALEAQAALVELNQLRGAAVDAPLRLVPPRLQFVDAPAADALIRAAREKNFEFRMRRVELEQQGFELRLARHERLPDVTVGPYLARENTPERETTVGLALSVPLPVTGRSRAGADAAAARQRQAEAALLAAGRELDRDVVLTAESYAAKLAEIRRRAPDAAEKFRESAALADRHYRLGAVPIATYVELQHSYLEAVEALLDTQKETIEAGLRLQQLTGLETSLVQISP